MANTGGKGLLASLSYNMLSQVINVIVPLLTAPYLSRILQVGPLGNYAYAYAVASYFLLFGLLGVSHHGTRSIAALREDEKGRSRSFSEIYTLQLCMTALAAAFYIGYILLGHPPDPLIAWTLAPLLLSGMLDITWLYYGMDNFGTLLKRNALVKLAALIGTFLFVRGPEDLWKYALLMGGSALVSQLLLWKNLPHWVRFKPVGFAGMKKHLRPFCLLFLPVISYSVYKYMSRILLGNLASMQAVGFYDSGDKINSVLLGLISAYGTVMLAHIAHGQSGEETGLAERQLARSMKLVTMAVAPLAFGLMGVSGVLAPVFFGADFAPVGPVIFYMGLAFLFSSWSSTVRMQYLVPTRRDGVYVISTLLGAAANIGVNLLLIPRMQERGAAIAIMVSEGVMMLSQALMIRKSFPLLSTLGKTLPFLLAGGVMALSVRGLSLWLGVGLFTLLLQIATGALLYIGMLLLYARYSRDDDVRQLFRRIGQAVRKAFHRTLPEEKGQAETEPGGFGKS